jgi:hypothetical protein
MVASGPLGEDGIVSQGIGRQNLILDHGAARFGPLALTVGTMTRVNLNFLSFSNSLVSYGLHCVSEAL